MYTGPVLKTDENSSSAADEKPGIDGQDGLFCLSGFPSGFHFPVPVGDTGE